MMYNPPICSNETVPEIEGSETLDNGYTCICLRLPQVVSLLALRGSADSYFEKNMYQLNYKKSAPFFKGAD